MPGPNSCPNGDTRVSRGHINEVFVCKIHGEKSLDDCEWKSVNLDKYGEPYACSIIPLREYLAQRNMLRTGKTK